MSEHEFSAVVSVPRVAVSGATAAKPHLHEHGREFHRAVFLAALPSALTRPRGNAFSTAEQMQAAAIDEAMAFADAAVKACQARGTL